MAVMETAPDKSRVGLKSSEWVNEWGGGVEVGEWAELGRQ